MMEMSMETPALDHLLGAYFHQDWRQDGTEREVVGTFVADEPDLAAALPHEVDALLSDVPGDAELERILREKGSYYMPTVGTGGYRPWLHAIADQVRQRRA